MKLTRKKLFCILGCVLGFCLIAGVLSYVITQGIKKNVFAQGDISFEEVSIQSNYSAFTYFEVPACSLIVDGDKHETTHTIILPDGRATKVNALNLEDAGKYKVIYSTVYDSKAYEKVYTFSVQGALYGIENGKRNYPTYANDEFGGAVNAVLSDGEVLNFYQPIDLNKLNKSSLIRFYNIASTPGNYDAEIIVTLTDVYNPNMNVKIRFFARTAETGFAMVHTSVNGSGWISLGASNATTPGAVEYNGEYYKTTLNSGWGSCIQGASMNGKGREGWWFPSFTDDNPTSPWWGEDRGTSAMPMNLYFDGATNCLYFRDGYYGIDNSGYDFVTDLDYQPFYGKNLKWTTGEVYLSIQGSNYMNATLNLMVEDVYGLDLSKNALPDKAAPEINIDLKGYSEDNLPKAVVGQPYSIFNATVTDKLNTSTYSSSKVELETNVYYNYYSDQKIYKQIIDGAFTPTVAGNYFIEYLSTDNFGHTAKKVLMIQAVNKSGDATLTITNKKTECEIAQKVILFDALSIDNVFGNQFYKISVTDNNGVEYAVDGDYSFAPKALGAHKVRIEYGGYSERYIEEYTLTLTGEGKNIYLEEPVFERYYIKNATHTVPTIKVNKLTATGGTEQEVQCKVIADGTTNLKVENNSFTVNATNSIVIEYYVGTEKIYTSSVLPVVDVGFKTSQLNIDKYFDAVGYSLVVDNEGTTLIMDIHARMEMKQAYKENSKLLKKVAYGKGKLNRYFKPIYKLSRCLEIKSTLGLEITNAYQNQDVAKLKKIYRTVLPMCLKRVDGFFKEYRKTYLSCNKSYGVEVVDIRCGAIKKRIEYAKEKIKDYLDGKIENIEELEIKRFPPRSFDKVGEDIEYNSFSQSLTGGIL
ncbi:MAG: hypothetical protein E7346_03925 [Clostridiales bacterium]|nr:hypothetical protein [Clostridiales bacterium]